MLGLVIFCLISSILVLAAFCIQVRRPAKITLEERLYHGRSSNRMIEEDKEKLSAYEKLQLELKQSGVNISVTVYFMIGVVSAAAVYFLMEFLLEDSLAAMVAALVVGGYVPRKVVSILRDRRMQEFDMAFSKALKRMSASIRSGSTLVQAIENIVETPAIPKIIREEMALVLVDYDYGEGIEAAFRRMADRTGVADVKGVSISIEIGMRQGSKLFEVFDNYVNTIMDRKEAEAEARATLAATKQSINMLVCVPFLFTAVMKFMSPDYFDPVYSFMGGYGKYIFLAIYGFVIFGYMQCLKKCDIRL